jgi:hypothetical protein
MRLFLALLVAGLICQTADAQLLSRWGRAQVSSSCPGGVCPTQTRYVSPPVATSIQNTVGINRGHWSFPGDIDSHLENDHGVSTAGMSRQQKLDLHDSLHEGTAPAVRRASAVVVRGTYPTVSSSSGYGSAGSRVSYGSTGSKVSYGSSGSRVGYGSSGSSFRVGGTDRDGAVITSIEQPKPAPKQPAAIKNDLTSLSREHTTFGL